jgi:hypothetical protein
VPIDQFTALGRLLYRALAVEAEEEVETSAALAAATTTAASKERY